MTAGAIPGLGSIGAMARLPPTSWTKIVADAHEKRQPRDLARQSPLKLRPLLDTDIYSEILKAGRSDRHPECHRLPPGPSASLTLLDRHREWK